MRQAIEEGFILDVLEHYTTYKTYWKLLKTIEDDPHYEKGKASYLLRSFVDLHAHAIRKKLEIMVEHFHGQVAHRIGGKAKAMIVTRSRLHAVRYKLAIDQLLRERGYAYKALVAFSGTVRDGGQDYTEPGMNGLPEVQTAKAFERPEYRFLIVANKFQTGFDQPLLHTMYVDKRLGGVNAVQTLSRLNRIHPEKTETMVLDFANEADAIQKAFAPYYEKTLLSESTDPHLLYDLERRLLDFHVYDEADIASFATLYFRPKTTQDQLYSALAPSLARYQELPEEERVDFRGQLTDYVRLYAFLAQILTFADADLEKLYVFARLLRRYLPARARRAATRDPAKCRHGLLPRPAHPPRHDSRSNVAQGHSTHSAPRTSIPLPPTPSSRCRRSSMTSMSALAPTFPKKIGLSSPTWCRSSPVTWRWPPACRSTPRKTPA